MNSDYGEVEKKNGKRVIFAYPQTYSKSATKIYALSRRVSHAKKRPEQRSLESVSPKNTLHEGETV